LAQREAEKRGLTNASFEVLSCRSSSAASILGIVSFSFLRRRGAGASDLVEDRSHPIHRNS